MEKVQLTWRNLDRLTRESVQALDDNLKGIYRLSYRHEDGNIYVFYVGKGEHIKEMLLNHLLETESNLCIKLHVGTNECFFKCAEIADQRIRDLVYRQACKFYQPSCNSDRVSEDVVEMNMN